MGGYLDWLLQAEANRTARKQSAKAWAAIVREKQQKVKRTADKERRVENVKKILKENKKKK